MSGDRGGSSTVLPQTLAQDLRAHDAENNKLLSPQNRELAELSASHKLCTGRWCINRSLYFHYKMCPWIPLQHPGTENMHNFTPAFKWTSSIVAFLALYSLPPHCMSRGTALSLPENINPQMSGLLPAEWLRDHARGHPSTGTTTDKPALLRAVGRVSFSVERGVKKHDMISKRLGLPLGPLAASWFSLNGNVKTKGRISPRLRCLDQIHPDMKWEQVPSGAVPAYSVPHCTAPGKAVLEHGHPAEPTVAAAETSPAACRQPSPLIYGCAGHSCGSGTAQK